jgi:hypothetical protein
MSSGEVLGGGFVDAEVQRFVGLLAVAGQQFGGEEHSKVRLTVNVLVACIDF